ncbi:hypothetical protein Fuma_03870 [Fuerstiella marisgermanici]|uniref:Uncharacterized protein n=1 Tax=Fuerstiella marisgermanici TaxID=1891926 RepID=A0A1P8WJL6_9PLAN|nr:hypothetical protein Fuma_03870 [Fuerstiella marisgermanici]
MPYMSSRKPVPLFDRQPRPLCPVCGETSYSPAGIHPQCAVRRLDDERMKKMKLRVAQGQQEKFQPPGDTSPWKRACPVCRATQHVRCKSCQCGHVFAMRPGVSPEQGEAL